MTHSVVISGLGIVSPLGTTAAAFRDALLAGTSAIAPIDGFDVSTCRTQCAAQVRGFDATRWISPMKLRRMDDTARFAVVIAGQALDDAAYPLNPDGDDRVGVVLGTFTAGGQPTSEYLMALHAGGAAGAPALLFNSTVGNAPASMAGLEYKLRGPNITVSLKEASSLSAVVTATDLLRQGRAAALVSGGVDALFDIFFRVHDRFGVMAPTGRAATPFAAEPHGFLLGEGGYALLLENEAGVAGRNRQPYGEILGVGAASAAVGINQWPDRTEPLARSMRAALADARVTPGDISVVYAGANGAPALDDLEACALLDVFDGCDPVVTSIKGMIGESGACGAASCIAALVCGAMEAVPPISGIDNVAPGAARLNIATIRRRLPGPLALINSVGSGGSLFSVVLGIRQ